MEKLIERIKYQISCFKSEKSKVGASQIDKLSLGGRIAALEELLADISTDERPCKLVKDIAALSVCCYRCAKIGDTYKCGHQDNFGNPCDIDNCNRNDK